MGYKDEKWQEAPGYCVECDNLRPLNAAAVCRACWETGPSGQKDWEEDERYSGWYYRRLAEKTIPAAQNGAEVGKIRDVMPELQDSLDSGGFHCTVLPRNHFIRQFDLAHGIDPDRIDSEGVVLSVAHMPPAADPERQLWVELGRLVEAAENCGYARAYLVLCGEGWTLDYERLAAAVADCSPPPELHVLRPEEFIALFAAGRL